MKEKVIKIVLLFLFSIIIVLTVACSHKHVYGEWEIEKAATCSDVGTKIRTCECGEIEEEEIPKIEHTEEIDLASSPTCVADGKTEGSHCSVCNVIIREQSAVPALGHTVVKDVSVPATCIYEGKTEGSHCNVCNAVLKEQTVVPALGHTTVIDAEIPATCIYEGKTEGSHCSTCNATLKPQENVKALGHKYDDGEVIEEATCKKEGTVKYSCTVTSCDYAYTTSYSMPTYTANAIYNQSVKYVGEIITYDKNGSEYAIGTGFVISSDGRVVTNYHVLEEACSATISINGTTYKIDSVLAYDKDIDLAVVKINATELATAKICKNSVDVGKTVYAIGSSRGMTNTYSQGIITYADREVDGVIYVQHDASITHGNSGGPLINEYGEVIGINTWGMTDFQNLNFAVFTAELDNLVYGTSLTLEELYLKECDTFSRLMNYIVENGTYDYDGNYYYITMGVTYSSDYTSKYTRRAYYYADSNTITLDLIINNNEWVYFTIDDSVDGSYYWQFFDDSGYKMSGTIYASTYDRNTLLGYSYSNMYTAALRDSARKLASAMVSFICDYIDRDFGSIGISPSDLCFYNY